MLKTHRSALFVPLFFACAVSSGRAGVIVDDTWSDGTRTNTSLPAESAWFSSSAASLTTAATTMTGTTSTSSRTWWTYFTTESGNPIPLAPGDTLQASLSFTASGVNASNSSRGFRVGLFDFSGGSRTTTDGNSPAATGVAGYLLNMNFGQTFGANNPLEIRERSNLPSSDLMGSSGDYMTLGSGGGAAGGTGVSDTAEYTLVLSVQRTASGAEVTTTLSGPAGYNVSATATTTNVVGQFDAFALRPSNTAQTAASFAFTRFKVELVPGGPSAPIITSQPQGRIVTVGQPAVFTVTASGTDPLSYQWFKEDQSLTGETGSSLTLNPVQPSDAGTYSVVVANSLGFATSDTAALTVTVPVATAVPDFGLVGFAALDGFSSNGTFLAGGTTGGAAGPNVQVTTVAELKAQLESTTTCRVEIMNDLDLSELANHSGGFPADYPTGEILVRSNKTIFSENGSTIRRGTLRIGKTSLGAQSNIIIRNLRFRDLWVYDPGGNYDTYGWDYVHLEAGSHHVWVDHCDFEKVYDGMIDLAHASDFTTVSWCVFRTQKKCSLIGHSDSNSAEDTGHLNVTLHHNHYVDVEERMPRMRFGNAHVFNLYCENLGGNGIQSTANAATLVENSCFRFPQSGTKPTREENGGPSGIIKVTGSVIENLPGVNVTFRESYPGGFHFNAPFAGPAVPYAYTLDPVGDVPVIVAKHAGVGKLGFVFWQQDNFTTAELADPALSGSDAILTADGTTNLMKYALGLSAWQPFAPAAPIVSRDATGVAVFTYRRPSSVTDIFYRVETSTNLTAWSPAGATQQRVATDANGMETWEARYTGSASPKVLFRLAIQR